MNKRYTLQAAYEHYQRRILYISVFLTCLVGIIFLQVNADLKDILLRLLIISPIFLYAVVIILPKNFSNIANCIADSYVELNDDNIIFNHYSNSDHFKKRAITILYSEITNIKFQHRRNELHVISVYFGKQRKVRLEGFEQSEQIYQQLSNSTNFG